MNLAEVPEMNFLEPDTKELQTRFVALYEEMTGRTLYPGNPERLFIDTLVAALVHTRAGVDQAYKQNTLKYASGAALDLLGTRRNCQRLGSNRARAIFQFVLTDVQLEAVGIPKGSIIIVDNVLEFATTADLMIAPGSLSGTVEAVANEPGSDKNGFLPGQLHKLARPIAVVAKVINVTATEGGADAEPDEQYRERIALAAYQYSTAVTIDSIVYHARSVSQNILDVQVVSPRPGRCEVYVLVKDGTGSDTLQQQVAEVLLRDDRRSGTMDLVVVPPVVVSYRLEFRWWLHASQQRYAEQIAAQVNDRVHQWTEKLSAKMGRSVVPSALVALLHGIDGVAKVEIVGPEYLVVDEGQVARCSETVIQDMGLL